MSDREHAGQKGAALLEMVMSMPLIAVLSVALGTAFVAGVRACLFLMSDWALQEQVGYAMERMVTDLRYAEDAKMENGRLKIYCRGAGESIVRWVVYERTSESVPRIRLDSQPLTGQSRLGKIAMEEFRAELVDPQTVFLRLSGKNTLTGQSFALETRVRMMGKAP